MIDREYHEHHLRLAAAPPVVARPSPSPGRRAVADLDKMARELLAAEYERHGHILRAAECLGGRNDLIRSEQALHVIRAALLTAPPGYVLVPVEPTQEMLDEVCSSDGFWPWTDDVMTSTYQAMIAAAPEPK